METKPLAAYYRGTDKFLEIEPVSPSQVFSYVDSHSGSGQAILIQTDQQQVRDYARNHYLDRCRFIEDIPVTKGSVWDTLPQRSLCAQGIFWPAACCDGRIDRPRANHCDDDKQCWSLSAPKDL